MMMPKYKGKEINTRPTDGMVSEAKKGLEWRKEHGRGGTEVGVARARDIQNRKELSFDTVKRMYSFFSRHEVDKKAEGFSPGEEGYPSAGRIAWALWGGDAGFSWSRKIAGMLDDDRNEEAVNMDNEVEVEATVESVEEVRAEEVVEETVEETAEAVEETTDEVVEETDRSASPEVQHRAMEMEMSPIDEETRTVKMALSSEEPVARSFGTEVLDHTREAIDLSFLASGRAPLLLDHDPEKQIGVIKSVQLDENARRLRAEVRFGKGELAREAFSDVVDGIKANISVGYSIDKMERDVDDKETYRAKSWKPVEASLVSIPADMTVGVGRSGKAENKPVIRTSIKEDNIMSEVNVEAVKAEAQQAAQKNAAQIVELGARHNKSDMAREAIASGKSIDEFRGALLESIGSQTALESQDIGMKDEEVKRFSMARAIHALANPTDRRAQENAAFEFECSRAAADQYGKTAQGIMLPADVLRNWKRDMNALTDDTALVTEDFRGGDFIDALRNQSSVMAAGARMLGGLSGDVKIPRKSAAATAAFVDGEGTAVGESEMTVGQVSLTPKTLGAFTDVTRQLLMQSSLDVEALIRDDLAKSIAVAIDKAGLEGSGANGNPRGILNTTGINTVTDFAAANPTFAEVVTLETAVAEDNALNGNLSYILPPAMYGALKTTEKADNTAQFVVEPGGTINGYNAIVSAQATSGNLYFGNFDDLLIGMFGGLDIVVDPYTASTSGTVRVVAMQSVDVAVRHAVSFAVGNDG
jgi:HK97 family phage major capsid protein/HK97 family phage prohead protease